MSIPVIFSDNSPGQVKPEELEELIFNRKIISFHRSEGWVRIGFDPIRRKRGNFVGFGRRVNE